MPEITCYDEPASGRDFQALETINCRLEAIPYAEGCMPPGMGADGCAGGELVPLPPIDGGAPPVDQSMAAEPAPEGGVPAAVKSNSPMRPSYEDRFRAGDATGLRAQPVPASAAKQAESEAKPPMWKRMFGS
jgi:hypothetical protein